jgi:hypothetical protein
MRERFIDLVFERPVPFFKFCKMRLDRHSLLSLPSDWLPDPQSVH